MPADLILTIAAVITACGVIIAALAAIYRFVKKISDSIGVDSKGRTIAERLDRVEHQLWENGGSSLADRVNLINAQTIRTATEVDFIKTVIVNANTAPVEIVKKTRH